MYLPQIDKSTKGKRKYRFHKASNTEDQYFLIPQININFFHSQVLCSPGNSYLKQLRTIFTLLKTEKILVIGI